MSFDTTIVELQPSYPEGDLSESPGSRHVKAGPYGVVELQTADTHGSYQYAVNALRNGLDLHPAGFHSQLAANPEWARRKIEGPNVANVFKRTIYQVAFKFQITKRDASVGSVLALPQPVWDSWKAFLGAPELQSHSDGTYRLLDDDSVDPSNWIYVFDIVERPEPNGGPTPIAVRLVIGTDAATLSRAALDVAPGRAVEYGGVHNVIAASISSRLQSLLPGVAV